MNKVKKHKSVLTAVLLAALMCSKNINANPAPSPEDNGQLSEIVAKHVKAYDEIKKAEEWLETNALMIYTDDSVRYKKEEAKVAAMKARAEDELMSALRGNPQLQPIMKVHEALTQYVAQRLQAPIEDDSDYAFGRKWDENLIKLIDVTPEFIDYPKELFIIDLSSIGDISYPSVVDSDDGRLRYYCWDTRRGGSMANIACFRQFRADNGNVLLSWGEYSGLNQDWEESFRVEDIITVEGEYMKIYLVKFIFGYGGMYYTEGYEANAIQLSQINLPIITYNADYEYDSKISVYYHLKTDRPDWMIKYDKQKRCIQLRETDEESNPTEKIQEYTFDGSYFRLSSE